MRYFKCLITKNPSFTIGKTYQQRKTSNGAEDGIPIIHDDDGVDFWLYPAFLDGKDPKFTRFEEVAAEDLAGCKYWWRSVPISMSEYQQQAMRTDGDHPKEYGSLGLCGEAGEVAELCKKHWFHSPNPNFRQRLIEELGDVLWYIARLANQEGIDLDTIAEANLEKLHQRHGHKYNSKGRYKIS